MDYKEIKRKEVLFEIIDDVTNGMDIYNHKGSLWIINTKELKWVVEFTNDKTLWYNYNLFKNLFKGISLDLMENQKYVTEWFESRFLNMQKVKDSCEPFFNQDQYVEDTIQNGVKDTRRTRLINLAADQMVEDTIQNGVKKTLPNVNEKIHKVEDAIQNVVKQTDEAFYGQVYVEDTIQNGVKHTDCYDGRRSTKVEDTIENGVKDIAYSIQKRKIRVENTIKNGVKDIKDSIFSKTDIIKNTIQEGVKQTELSKRDFFPEDILQNGVKETLGTLRRTAEWGVDDIIQNGIKDTKSMCGKRGGRVGNTIQNGVKNLGAIDYDNLKHVEGIIENGVKETHEDTYHHKDRIGGVIRNGEKIS
jgi:hypothetical protein